MSRIPFKLAPGSPVTWDMYNNLLDYIDEQTNIGVVENQGLTLDKTSSGTVIGVTFPGASYFWAIITGVVPAGEDGAGSYTFTEAAKSGAGYGEWTQVTGGRSGVAWNMSQVDPGLDISVTSEGNGSPTQLDTFPVKAGRPVLIYTFYTTDESGKPVPVYWFDADIYMQQRGLLNWKPTIIFARITDCISQVETYAMGETVTRYIYAWEQVYKKDSGYESVTLQLDGTITPNDPADPWLTGGFGDTVGGVIDRNVNPATIGDCAAFNFAEVSRDFSGDPVPVGTVVQMAKTDYTNYSVLAPAGPNLGAAEYWFHWKPTVNAFWAVIDSSSATSGQNSYTFSEVEKSLAGYVTDAWVPKTGGISGSAYNGAEYPSGTYDPIPDGSIVLVQVVPVDAGGVEYWISDVMGGAGVNPSPSLKQLYSVFGSQDTDSYSYSTDGAPGTGDGVQWQPVTDLWISGGTLYARTRGVETDENGHVIAVGSECAPITLGSVGGGVTPDAGATPEQLGDTFGTQNEDHWTEDGSSGTKVALNSDARIGSSDNKLYVRQRAITVDENGFVVNVGPEGDEEEIGTLGVKPDPSSTITGLAATQGTQNNDTWTYSANGAGSSSPHGVSEKVITEIYWDATNGVLVFRTRTNTYDENGMLISISAESDLTTIDMGANC